MDPTTRCGSCKGPHHSLPQTVMSCHMCGTLRCHDNCDSDYFERYTWTRIRDCETCQFSFCDNCNRIARCETCQSEMCVSCRLARNVPTTPCSTVDGWGKCIHSMCKPCSRFSESKCRWCLYFQDDIKLPGENMSKKL